jgi:hypothetical protein
MANNHAALRFPAIEMSKQGKAGFTDNFEFACRSSFSYCYGTDLGQAGLDICQLLTLLLGSHPVDHSGGGL